MGYTDIPSDPAFTGKIKTLGMISAWLAFGVNEVYAIVSGIAFASQGAAVESGPYLSMMAALVVIMGPFLIFSMVAVHAYAPHNLKIYGLASLAFMVACITITSCINFLLLMVSSRPDLFSESWRALFLPCRWPAPAFVLDNFVWDWFFGLSMLLAAPIFAGNKLKLALRSLLIASGALCLAGLAWIAVSPSQAVIVGILGWGATGPLVFLLLAHTFTRVSVEGKNGGSNNA